jgi:hypothetical protein
MGNIVRLTLLNKPRSPDATLVTIPVPAPEPPPRVSTGIDASECFRCLMFEVVCAIVVGVVNDDLLGVPVPLFFEGKESAVPALTPL